MKIIIVFILIILCFPLLAENTWLGRDKVAHFVGSAFITYWNFGVCNDWMKIDKDQSILFSLSFTLFLGAGKEWSDQKLSSSGWSWQDLVYDALGVSAGLVLINNLR
jgi:putative lipoprotein